MNSSEPFQGSATYTCSGHSLIRVTLRAISVIICITANYSFLCLWHENCELVTGSDDHESAHRTLQDLRVDCTLGGTDCSGAVSINTVDVQGQTIGAPTTMISRFRAAAGHATTMFLSTTRCSFIASFDRLPVALPPGCGYNSKYGGLQSVRKLLCHHFQNAPCLPELYPGASPASPGLDGSGPQNSPGCLRPSGKTASGSKGYSLLALCE